MRVFTDEENNFRPQIIAEAIHLDLDGLDMEKVYALKEAEKTEELYKYLLIVQCNALNAILQGMFQKLSDYTELLLPDNLLREGSVIQQMIELIPEEDWKDAVQIIGWLYQYYNSEKKQSGYCGFFTPYVWMFIQSYEKMRNYLYNQATIETLIQFEYCNGNIRIFSTDN